MTRRSHPLKAIFDVKAKRGAPTIGAQIGTVSTPQPPPLLDTLTFTAFSNLVAIGNYLFVTAPSDGVFYVIDKTDPTNLGTPASFGTVDQRPISAAGNIIYVVGGGELRVWDVTTPTSPSLSGSTSTGGAISNASGMVASGGRVYVSNAAGDQIRNFGVSTPSAPTLTSTKTDATNLNGAQGLAFQGSHVYVAATDGNRLTAVNISVPATMTIADTETNADLAACVDAQINLQYVYVVSPTGLIVADKTTPTALSYVTTVSIPNAVVVEVSGDHAFVLTDDGIGSAELIVLDITNPAAPTVISSATIAAGLLGAPRDMALDNDVLFVADEGNGAIYAFDVAAFP